MTTTVGTGEHIVTITPLWEGAKNCTAKCSCGFRPANGAILSLGGAKRIATAHADQK